MHKERSSPRSAADVLPTAKTDTKAECSVLRVVLAAYPELFTENELVREIAGDPGDFMQRDTVERAIRSLAVVGLLHRCHPIIIPTRAAMRFEALEQEDEA